MVAAADKFPVVTLIDEHDSEACADQEECENVLAELQAMVELIRQRIANERLIAELNKFSHCADQQVARIRYPKESLPAYRELFIDVLRLTKGIGRAPVPDARVKAKELRHSFVVHAHSYKNAEAGLIPPDQQSSPSDL